MTFHIGSIVHVDGFYSQTSTGEVVGMDGWGLYTVHFEDGETAMFAEDELRLPTDDELYVYLYGYPQSAAQRILQLQPARYANLPLIYPRPLFAIGQCVVDRDFGTGMVIEQHDDTGIPYYLVSFGYRGETVACDDSRLMPATHSEIDVYAGPSGLDLDRDVIAYMKSFLPKETR